MTRRSRSRVPPPKPPKDSRLDHFKRDQIIVENGDLGIILQSGPLAYDVLWIGGSTTRYLYSTGRHVRGATEHDLEYQESMVAHLRDEVASARQERREGERIRRGQVSPRR